MCDEIKSPELTKPDQRAMPSGKVESTKQMIEIEKTEPVEISEFIPDATTLKQKSPKLKAKIAKPIEKRRKKSVIPKKKKLNALINSKCPERSLC